MRFRAAISLVLLVSPLASTAAAGVIRGTLWAPAPRVSVENAHALPDRHRQRGVSDAVIYVERVPKQVERKLAGRSPWFFWKRARPRVLTIVLMDRQFRPHVLATPLGGRVAFQNLDRAYHNAFSVSAAKLFDLGKHPPGRRDTLVFDRAGVINLHCDIHPDMVGYIVVTPNHAFTRPDVLGRYRLPKLPGGTYAIHVFHPRWGEINRTVRLPQGGNVTLDLPF